MNKLDIVSESRKNHRVEVILFPWGLATGPSTEREGGYNVYHIKSGEIVAKCDDEAHAARMTNACNDMGLNWHWTRPQSIAFAKQCDFETIQGVVDKFIGLTRK